MNTHPQDNRIHSTEPAQGLGRLTAYARRHWVWIAIAIITILFIILYHFRYSYRIECLDTLPKETSLPTKRMQLTDKAFVILGLALTVSTYISTVSRETIASLKSDLYARRDGRRISRMVDKVQRFYLLLISDLLVWVLIAFPVSVVIFYWCWCLPATKPFFETLQNWIVYGVLALTLWMAFMHIIQAWQHFKVVLSSLEAVDKSKSAQLSEKGESFGTGLLQSKYFLEDLSLIKALLTDEELAVYIYLANHLANRHVIMQNDSRTLSAKWTVVIQKSELPLATGLDMHRLNSLLNSLTLKGLISRIKDDEKTLCCQFNRFDGCYDMDLRN